MQLPVHASTCSTSCSENSMPADSSILICVYHHLYAFDDVYRPVQRSGSHTPSLRHKCNNSSFSAPHRATNPLGRCSPSQSSSSQHAYLHDHQPIIKMAVRIIVTATIGFLLVAFCIFLRQRDRDVTASKHGCGTVVQHATKEPFSGLDYHLIMHADIPSVHRYHQRHGKTFAIRPWIALPSFATIAPENIRVINTGKEWGGESLRRHGSETFCGRGFFDDGW
jgi:hypothetical protein